MSHVTALSKVSLITSERDRQFPRIGHADERCAPGQGGALVVVLPTAMVQNELDGSHHPCLDRMVGRFEGEDQKGLLVVVDAVDAGLLIVDDAQIGRVKAGLTDGAHRLGGRKKIGKAEHGATPEAGPVLQPHPGLDDHAERAFRADDHTVGAWPGARAGQAAGFHDACRRDGADAFDEIVDMGIEAWRSARPSGSRSSRRG